MRIALLGDIAPFGRYCVQNSPEVLSQLEDVKRFLQIHDLVVGNLETPFVEGRQPVGAKSAHICAHPANIALLQFLGVTHVTLANNHTGDFGLEGYLSTKATLNAAGIDWFGTEGRVCRLSIMGEKVSLIGYCSLNTNPSPIRAGSEQLLNILDVDEVVRDLEESHRDGYFPILAIHSGQEHVHSPSSEDVRFARKLASRLNYVYYGHHPHVIQGYEDLVGSVAFYSLGNFVFDDIFTPRDRHRPTVRLSEANKTGLIASVELADGRLVGWSVTPIYLGEDRVEVGDAVDLDPASYNPVLSAADTDQYDMNRRQEIAAYFADRRAKRDLIWYLNRINLNSVRVFVAGRRNVRQHMRKFSSKLSGLSG